MSDVSILDVLWLLLGFILAFGIIDYIDRTWGSRGL